MRSGAPKFECWGINEGSKARWHMGWYAIDKEVKHGFELIEVILVGTCVLLEVEFVLIGKLGLLDLIAI
uniref:Uncharacterized protein n=1 Tax=Physcomitrium patens TaxID=3218 RepID=A0A2K1LAB5_PHYPA|nr:hypothetical protein PHYPA_001392 [Physcomitrium patens]